MKIISWNVNSVRSRIEHLKELINNSNPDIICLQETKVENSSFPIKVFEEMGFKFFALNGMKSYNGVCILSKIEIKKTKIHSFCGINDARHISAKIDFIDIHNLYIPAGGDDPDISSNPKFKHKILFLDELSRVFLKKNKNVLICGDFNIAPLKDDVWSHKQLQNTVSHTDIEREKLLDFMKSGPWIDIIRKKVNPPSNVYTWWSYRSTDFNKNNRGRRLDHIWCSSDLSGRILSAKIYKIMRNWVKPSDHVPIETVIKTY